MPASTQPTTRLRDYRPEPSNFWIRHGAVWDAAADLVWVDLAQGALGGAGEGRGGTGHRFAPPDDVLYLPPGGNERERSTLADWCAEREAPFYVQQIIGQVAEMPPGGTVLVDPLAVLIEGRVAELETASHGATTVWPVLPGLTDHPELLSAGLEHLRTAGVACVVPVGLELTPTAGRALTERFGEKVFDAVFHSGEVDVRPVVRACHASGMPFLPPRPPLPGVDGFGRQVASELALIGEMWAASGESPAEAQEYFRAAAWIEETHFDLRALERDDNLGIVPSLSAGAVRVIRELAGGVRRSTMLRDLVERFAGAA